MTLGNMRALGVQRLIASCLNSSCRHDGLIEVSKYPDDTEVPWFANKRARSAAPVGRSSLVETGVLGATTWAPLF